MKQIYSTFAIKKRNFILWEITLLLGFVFFLFHFNILEVVINDVVYQKQMPIEIQEKMALYFSGFRKYFYLLLFAYLILKIIKALFGAKFDKSQPITFQYQISDNSLIYQQLDAIKSEIEWSVISEIKNNRRSLDFISPYFIISIPKSAFSDENQFNIFQQNALKFWQAKQNL